MATNSTDDYVPPLSGWSNDGWILNSVVFLVADGPFVTVMYCLLALGIIIFLHSWYINGTKYRRVRICTDVAAITTVIQMACYLGFGKYCPATLDEPLVKISGGGCSYESSAIVLNVVSLSIAGCLNQICDNYIVFNRYAVIVQQVSFRHKYFASIYVVFFLYLSWWPFYTLVPFFINLNSVEALLLIYYCAVYMLFVPYVLYNLFYTALVIKKLKEFMKHSTISKGRKQSLEIIVIKAVIHNFISAGGIAAYSFWPVYGLAVYNTCTMVSLHFLFNWKIDSALFGYASTNSRDGGRSSLAGGSGLGQRGSIASIMTNYIIRASTKEKSRVSVIEVKSRALM